MDKEQFKKHVIDDFFNHFTYKKDHTYFKWRDQDTPQRVLDYIFKLIDKIYD